MATKRKKSRRATRRPGKVYRRRRTASRGGMMGLRGFINKDFLMGIGGATAGMMVPSMAAPYLPKSFNDYSPKNRALILGGIGVGAGLVITKFNKPLGISFATGAAAAALVNLWQIMQQEKALTNAGKTPAGITGYSQGLLPDYGQGMELQPGMIPAYANI